MARARGRGPTLPIYARTATGTSSATPAGTTIGWCATPTGGGSRPGRSCSWAKTHHLTRERAVLRGLVPAADPVGRVVARRCRGRTRGRLPPLRGDTAPRRSTGRRRRSAVDSLAVDDVPGGGGPAAGAGRNGTVGAVSRRR